MNSAQFCFCACGLLLAWALAGCSQQSGPESKETRTVTQTLEPADPGQVPQLPEPVVPTLMSELQQLCENMETLPAPFSSIRSEVRQAVADLYTQRQYQPWWFDGEAFESELAESVLDSFSLATLHALDPDDYFPDELRLRWSQMSQVVKADRLRERALTDLVFTLSVTALAYDLHLGRVPHQHVVSTWRGVEKTFDAASLLSRIPGGEPVETILESYAPPHEKYQHLRRALATYRHIAGRGGWEPVDARLLNSLKDRELESGSHPLVPLLRKRLAQEGYAVPPTENPALQDIYDEPLQKVMRQFQANRGLEPDGIVGPLTLKAINIPVEKLIGKIIWSMDRCRWLPEQLGERHILVNVPEFTLRAYQAGEEPLQMRVIVGDSKKGTFTPIFADEMEYVIFRPYWNVPRSIIRGELVPEIKKDRDHIKKFNYEIVDRFSPNAEVFKPSRANIERLENGELKIRQTAGPYNALGLVKFIFPNEHSVYLHDTNQRNLFVYSQRDMSHGCIRVHEPEALARFALPASQWTEESIRQAMYEGERRHVSVGSTIPVYIFYLTAFPAVGTGPIGFFEDLYQYDARMAAYEQNAANVAVR